MLAFKLGWERSKLGDYFRIMHGYAFKGRFFANQGRYIVLTPGNFNPDGGIKLKGEKEKYYAGDFPEEYLLNQGELLIVMTDLTQNAPILGSPAFIPESHKFLHNQRLGKIVDLDRSRMDPRFLYCLFNSHSVRAQIKASATGATVRHTAPTRIYDVEVDVPPLLTQRKIAAILSAYDDLIENNTRRIAILEEMAQAIYREWFVHFRFPGHETVAMVDSELGLIPEGWEVVKFLDIATILRQGIHPCEFEDEVFAHYSFPAFDTGCMPSLERGGAILSNKYLVDHDCVLLSKLNPRIPRVWLPFPDSNYRAIASTEFLVLLPKRPLTRSYLFSLCCSPEFLAGFAALTLGTSTSHQRVKPHDLLNMDTILPPQALIDMFSDLTNPMLEVIHMLRLRTTNLRRTRDLLLPRLISGELDVSDLAIAVPSPL